LTTYLVPFVAPVSLGAFAFYAAPPSCRSWLLSFYHGSAAVAFTAAHCCGALAAGALLAFPRR